MTSTSSTHIPNDLIVRGSHVDGKRARIGRYFVWVEDMLQRATCHETFRVARHLETVRASCVNRQQLGKVEVKGTSLLGRETGRMILCADLVKHRGKSTQTADRERSLQAVLWDPKRS